MNTPMRTPTLRSSGFTVVELIIVIAVIGILASIAIVSFSSTQTRANRSSADATVQQVKLKLGEYFTDNNQYPKTKADVVTYLGTVNAAATGTAFNAAKNSQNITYEALGAGGVSCSSASVPCVTYTITVPVAYWKGGSGDTAITVTP